MEFEVAIPRQKSRHPEGRATYSNSSSVVIGLKVFEIEKTRKIHKFPLIRIF